MREVGLSVLNYTHGSQVFTLPGGGRILSGKSMNFPVKDPEKYNKESGIKMSQSG